MSNVNHDGSASLELQRCAIDWWREAAKVARIDLTGFDPKASLEQRRNWATSRGLLIGTILARQSTKMQDSLDAQVRDNAEYAARHGIYTPPEPICADVLTGRKSNQGLAKPARRVQRGGSNNWILVSCGTVLRKHVELLVPAVDGGGCR